MKKRLPIIIFVIVVLYTAVFAAIMAYTILLPSKVYDDQKLLSSKQSSANKVNYKLSRQDDITTITCDKMQGMDVIWEYKADEDTTRQVYYDLVVTSGKAKLILIQPDDTVITLVEQDSSTSGSSKLSGSGMTDDSGKTSSALEDMTTLDLKKGINRIKLVCGKGTAFSLTFKIPE